MGHAPRSHAGAIPLALAIATLTALGSRATARQAEVEVASLMTTPVILLNGVNAVLQGTGFFFASTGADGNPETVFLVTNYHVVTGHAPTQSGNPQGDRVQFLFHEDRTNLAKVRRIEIPLYDIHGKPRWVSSGVFADADVVLLPLPAESYARIQPYVFTEAHTRGDIKLRPTSGAALVGYPYGLSDTAHDLPVWKTGHIATEPAVDFDDRPVFLVDVSAFPGMSGSPVLAVANGIYETEDGPWRTGRVLKLLGIFSAMPVVREQRPADPSAGIFTAPPPTETSLQLGYVWKAALIANLAANYKPQ